MSKKIIVIASLLPMIFYSTAQTKVSTHDLSKGDFDKTILSKDTITYKDIASQTLRALRNGAVIVRLKTNQRNVEAYRKAGKINIAEQIEADRQKQNEKMYQAFTRNFHFCKIYFIYANETEQFIKGNRKIFLNQHLYRDSTIVFTDTNFVFCEYGSVESFSKFQDYEHPVAGVYSKESSEVIPTETATSSATTSGLVFSDKRLQQLHRPFPFVVGVYMENYDAPVRALNRELERAYERLVVTQDFKNEIKAQRKKERQKRKKEPKYNPFK